MFETLIRRVEAGAGEAVGARVAAVAEAFRSGVPGAEVTVEGGNVTVRARGLVRRWLDSAVLRSIGNGR
ncbi:MAG: hypothetical protein ABR588_02550 [Sphingomicrobium sp.]